MYSCLYKNKLIKLVLWFQSEVPPKISFIDAASPALGLFQESLLLGTSIVNHFDHMSIPNSIMLSKCLHLIEKLPMAICSI